MFLNLTYFIVFKRGCVVIGEPCLFSICPAKMG